MVRSGEPFLVHGGAELANLLGMNEIVHDFRTDQLPTTQAAEGVPSLRWTTAQLIRLTELGIFRREDRFELIGGEIVPMSPIGRRHEVVAEEIEIALRKIVGGAVPQLVLRMRDLGPG